MIRRILQMSMICMVLFTLQQTAHAAVSVIPSMYQPNRIYTGPFSPAALYYRNPGNPQWRRGFRRELKDLICQPAVVSFSTAGIWKGHLNPDGTCADPSEPVEWAVGNRLNFEGASFGTAK